MATINVAAAGLLAAMLAASPGDVIQQTGGPGAPLGLVLSAVNKANPGVAVVLDPAQLVMLTTTGASGGFHFYNGTWAADLVNGLTASPNNYSVRLGTGANRFSFLGTRWGQGAYHVVAGNVTDIWIDSGRFDYSRGDAFNFTDYARVYINNCSGGEFTGGTQFCYFDDGTSPQEGISQSACEVAQSGHWVDTTHLDTFQGYASSSGTGCSDLTLTNNDATVTAQGLDAFGNRSPNGIYLRRAKIWGNTVRTAETNAYVFAGSDFDVRNNTAVGHPFYGNTDVKMIFTGDPAKPSFDICGMGNSCLHLITTGTTNTFGPDGNVDYSPGAPTQPTAPSTAVNLASPTLNGATVAPAALPVQVAMMPAWFPAIPTRPASLVATTAPFSSAGGTTIYPAGPFTAGVWASGNRGKWGNAVGATFAFRWKVNTSIVATGPQNYQGQVGDNGTLFFEVQSTGANGLVSDWVSSAGIAISGGSVMAKYTNPAAQDAQLAKYALSNRMTLCSAVPANVAGIAAVALATVTPTFTGPSAGSPDGRQLSVDAKSNVTVTANGTAVCVALDDGTTLWAVDDYTATAVVAGGQINISAWVLTARNPA